MGRLHFGFTLIEVMLAVTIAAILLTLIATMYQSYRDRVDVNRAVSDIMVISASITEFKKSTTGFRSAWRRSARTACAIHGEQHTRTSITRMSSGWAQFRKDKNIVPINSDFDLWSNGKDGASAPRYGTAQSRRRHSRQRRRILRAGLEIRPVRLDGTFLRSKVARRIVLLFVLSALIPIALSAALSFSQVQDLLVEQGHAQLAQTSEGYAASLYDRLLAVEQRMNDIAERIKLGSASAGDDPSRLQRQFKSIGIVDPAGGISALR